ncbi:uroporphyrinogen-III C-methyltransferase [Ferrimonas pelagia]|uniref:Uroporphyrinogen-III C-methyltransferase n=1 Tax=Ferrimonas pelagia TaxID=1177826 RepID=A0ABP9EXQ4_9GAMM
MEKTPKDPKDQSAAKAADPQGTTPQCPDAESAEPSSLPTEATASQAEKADKVKVSPSKPAATEAKPSRAEPGKTKPSAPTDTKPEKAQTASASRPIPEKKPTEAIPKDRSEPHANAAAPARSGGGGGGALAVALLALIVALGAGAFAAWQWQQDQQIRQDNAVLASQLASIEQNLQQQRQTLERRVERSEGQLQSAGEALSELRAQQQQVERNFEVERSRLRERKPRDWMIAEADYLVRMAARKLWLEHDPVTAVALLKDADSRLSLLAEPELTPVRQALADDVALIEGLPRSDRAGLALAMEALVQRIDQLPLNTVTLPDLSEAPTSTEISASANDWKQNLTNSWHALVDDFITVRRRQDSVTPLLAPEQAWYLREHLKGKLLQAQLALYHGDQQTMAQALLTAQDWIRDYFSLESAEVDSALGQLEQWRMTNIAPLQPIRLSASPALEALVAERLGRNGEAH